MTDEPKRPGVTCSHCRRARTVPVAAQVSAFVCDRGREITATAAKTCPEFCDARYARVGP